VIPPLRNSDHNGFTLTLKTKRCSVWKYAQADFEKANRLIEATDWTFLHNETNVDLAWDIWEKKFMEIMEKCIPKVTIFAKHNLP